VAFFQQYNVIREIINRNSLRDGNGDLLDKEATMPNSPLIQHLGTKLEMLFSGSALNPGDADYTSWKEIGITRVFKGKDNFSGGVYTIDAAKLGKCIASNFKGVEKLFANYSTSSHSNFVVSNSPNASISSVIANQNITVEYTATADGCMARLRYYNDSSGVDEDTGSFILDNPSQIVGPEGTIFEGLTIVAKSPFTVGQSAEFSVKVSQGLTIGIKKGLEQLLDKKTGEFKSEQERIQAHNKNLQKQVESAEEKAKRIEKQWSAHTARLYTERMRYEQFSKFLDNMYKAMNNN
jgi:flagellar capping protein FliD